MPPAPVTTLGGDRPYLLQIMTFCVSVKPALPFPVTVGEQESVLRHGLVSVVALAAEVVIRATEAVVPRPREVLRTADGRDRVQEQEQRAQACGMKTAE